MKKAINSLASAATFAAGLSLMSGCPSNESGSNSQTEPAGPTVIHLSENEGVLHSAGVHIDYGMFDEAEKEIEGLLERVPDYPEALRLRSRLNIARLNFPAAVEAAKYCMVTAPDQIECVGDLALAEEMLEHHDEALLAYRQYVEGGGVNNVKLARRRITALENRISEGKVSHAEAE